MKGTNLDISKVWQKFATQLRKFEEFCFDVLKQPTFKDLNSFL